MLKTIILTLLVTTIPVATIAQDASTLGPAANSAGAASPQTLNLLQPANPSGGLQSADATSGGINVPQQQNLQQAGNSDQVKVFIQGEGEGRESVESESEDSSSPYWVLLIPAAIGTILWFRLRKLKS